jgi:hypothetical protein
MLSNWIPCTTPPVRDGWYDVHRNMNLPLSQPIERVRFHNGSWDRESCKSKVAIWSGYDYWRGVTEESKGVE